VTFFEPLPPAPDPTEPQPTGWVPPLWDRPSEALLGVLLPMSTLLAKTDDIAVALGDVTAYPNGFTFNVEILGNPMAPRPSHQHGMFHYPGLRERGPRIGFAFADGSRASDHAPRPSGGQMMVMIGKDDEGVPTTPVLVPRGGGGGGHHYSMRYWCFPLPPPGTMDLYLEWADVGIHETKVTLDADAVREAATRVVTLWEYEPGS